MQIVSPVKTIAACAALAGFAIAVLAGLAVNNPADVILTRGVTALFVCYAVGGVIGLAMEFAVSEGMRDYKESKPLPMAGAGAPTDGTRPSA